MKKAFFLLFFLSCLGAFAATGNANDGAILALMAILLVFAFPSGYYLFMFLKQKFHHKAPPHETDPS
jgi:hypothetical protein